MQKLWAIQQAITKDLEVEASFEVIDTRGLYWGTSAERGSMLALFFRPTGISQPGPQSHLRRISRNEGPCDFRFSLEMCNTGAGSGGIQVVAHSKMRESGRKLDRMELLTEDWSKPFDMGEEVGPIGWVPRELAPLLRPLLYTSPYFIPHYSWRIWGNDQVTALLSLVIWSLAEDDRDLARGMMRDYDAAATRTNLDSWRNVPLFRSWTIPSGVESELDVE